MKLLKKIATIVGIIVIVSETLLESVPENKNNIQRNYVRAGAVIYNFDDPYADLLMKSLKNIQEKNKNKIKFDFYDSKNSRDIQNENISMLLENNEINLLILSLVDLVNDPKEIIDQIKAKNIPVIFISKRTLKVDENVVKSYDKAYYIVPNSAHGGTLQGKLLASIWNKNISSIDMNKDNIMQYVMLEGKDQNAETIARSKYAIMEMQDEGIKTEQLASRFCDWNEDIAREATEGLLIRYGNKIEVIIANNDAMAIGAVKALQKCGYNKGQDTKNIPVVGIDGLPEAEEFINRGYMAGTILQDPDDMAQVICKVGMYLVCKIDFNCKEEYECDRNERIIELPFKKYVS